MKNIAYALVFFLCPYTLADYSVAIDKSYVEMAPYIVDDLTEAYRIIGINPVFHILPGVRAISLANSGVYDALDARYKNSPQLSNMETVDVEIYLETNFRIWSSDTSTYYESVETLSHLKLASSRSTAFSIELEKQGYNLALVNSDIAAVRMAEAGRVDAVLIGDFTMSRVRNLGFGLNLKRVSVSLKSEWLYHHVHEKHRELVPQLEKAIQRLKAQGKFVIR